MRTIKDRAMLLINFICGEDKAKELFDNESLVLLNGQLFIKTKSDTYENAIYFSYSDIPFNHVNYKEKFSFDSFKAPFSTIENDESKTLQACFNSFLFEESDNFKDRYPFYHNNKEVIDKIYKTIPENKNVILRYKYEEFNGVVKKNIHILFNNHGSWPDFKFKSTSFDLKNDDTFFESVSEYFSTYFATYIPAELIKQDLDGSIKSLGSMISEEDHNTQMNKPIDFDKLFLN